MPAGRRCIVHEIIVKTIENMPSNPKMRHPEFEKRRKAGISLALSQT